MALSALSFGFIDWDNPGLVTDFYPDDLPDDWRLDYYANEYPVVFVPADKWRNADDDELESWRDDAEDALGFVFEGDDTESARLVEIFADAWLGMSQLPPPDPQQPVQQMPATASCRLVLVDVDANDSGYLKKLRAGFEVQTFDAELPLVIIVRTASELVNAMASIKTLLDLMGIER